MRRAVRRARPPCARLDRHRHGGRGRAGEGDRLDLRSRRQLAHGEVEGVDGAHGERAARDADEVVAAVPAHREPSRAIGREADPRARAESGVVGGDRLDLDVEVEARERAQLVPHATRLERALGRDRDVLVVAAAAAPRPGVGAGRRDAVGRGLEHLGDVRARPGRVLLGHLGQHPLALDPVADEHHPAVGRARDEAAAGRGCAQSELDRRHCAHPSTRRGGGVRLRPSGRTRRRASPRSAHG